MRGGKKAVCNTVINEGQHSAKFNADVMAFSFGRMVKMADTLGREPSNRKVFRGSNPLPATTFNAGLVK